MADYKLSEGGVKKAGMFIPEDVKNRDWSEYLIWVALGNTADPADQPTAEQIAKEAEILQAPLTARQYFTAHPAAITFIRLTPAEQETAIEGYTLAQLKTVVKYLTIAVAALVKQDYLE